MDAVGRCGKMVNDIGLLETGSLLNDARSIIEKSRANAVRSVDFCRVQMVFGKCPDVLEFGQANF